MANVTPTSELPKEMHMEIINQMDLEQTLDMLNRMDHPFRKYIVNNHHNTTYVDSFFIRLANNIFELRSNQLDYNDRTKLGELMTGLETPPRICKIHTKYGKTIIHRYSDKCECTNCKTIALNMEKGEELLKMARFILIQKDKQNIPLFTEYLLNLADISFYLTELLIWASEGTPTTLERSTSINLLPNPQKKKNIPKQKVDWKLVCKTLLHLEGWTQEGIDKLKINNSFICDKLRQFEYLVYPFGKNYKFQLSYHPYDGMYGLRTAILNYYKQRGNFSHSPEKLQEFYDSLSKPKNIYKVDFVPLGNSLTASISTDR